MTLSSWGKSEEISVSETDVKGQFPRLDRGSFGLLALSRLTVDPQSDRSGGDVENVGEDDPHSWAARSGAQAAWIDEIRQAHSARVGERDWAPGVEQSLVKVGGRGANVFQRAYNQTRAEILKWRLTGAELARRPAVALDITPLFQLDRAEEKGGVIYALTALAAAVEREPEEGVGRSVQFIVDESGVGRRAMEAQFAQLGRAGGVWLRAEKRGTSRVRFRFRGSGEDRAFTPEGTLSLRGLREEVPPSSLLPRVGVSDDRIALSDRSLLNRLVALVPLTAVLSTELSRAIENLRFLQIQA
jgi:hypothetical protein